MHFNVCEYLVRAGQFESRGWSGTSRCEELEDLFETSRRAIIKIFCEPFQKDVERAQRAHTFANTNGPRAQSRHSRWLLREPPWRRRTMSW